jgi:type IV pilus assembly protein PilE
MPRTRITGFTLIEVMIVVAILAILAGVAVPAYSNYVTRSKLSEAIANLSDMRVKMEQYFLDNRTYAGACVGGTVAPLPTGKYFDYACPAPSAAAYTITATAKAGQGMDSLAYSINEKNERVTVGVPTGWTMPATNCWALKKDGSC